MPKNRERRAVLISRFSALGDVAMTLPTVYDACAANPDTQFYFLTRHHPARVFINRPDNLTMATVNLDNYKGIPGLWRLAKALRKRYGITDYVDLHDVLRTKVLRLFMQIAGVRTNRIRKGRRAKKQLTRRNQKVLVQLKPTVDRYKEVFYAAGIPLANDFRSLYGNGKGDPNEFAAVTSPKRPGEKWLAVAPFAKHKGKIYPFENMERVIAHFDHTGEYKIFIFGFGKEETELIGMLEKRYAHVVNMARANIGIPAELSLLSHCDTMLSMDSANMHLASLVALRTVSVWGATHPYTGFLGWQQRTRDVVQLDMTCRPCSVFGDKPCFRGDYHCLNGITPMMIINKIEKQSF
ncbi:MAG: glycosyl transferase family 1 [Candidatus Amulumruptor caecigallinarius]|nr:glycosyl transferase family 1 [Candidatus Amulumruptor caecigallinarius]